MGDPVVPLERNLYGHPLAGLLWEKQFEKILLKHGWEKIPSWECLFVHREKGLFLSVYVDDIKLDGKKQNIAPMWKVLNKEVDLGEPTSLFDHVYLGCTQRECQTSKDLVDNFFEVCLNPKSLQEQKKRYLVLGNLSQTSPHGPMIWKAMQRSVWNNIANLQIKQLNK